MQFEDFEYNDKLLSDFGMIIGFVTSSVEEAYTMTGERNLTTVKVKDRTMFVSSTAEPISFSFDIIQNPCRKNYGLKEDEVNLLLSWLDNDEYLKFQPLFSDRQYLDIHFIGIFTNISLIKDAGIVLGLQVTFQADSNHGYGDDERYEIIFNSSNTEPLYISNATTQLGYTYLDKIEITCNAAGDIYLTNSLDTKKTIIKNCAKGEKITLLGNRKIIQSSVNHEKLANDFNYNFPRIITKRREYIELSDSENLFTIDQSKMSDCSIVIDYIPYRKVGLFI